MNRKIIKLKAYYHAFKICFSPSILWIEIQTKYTQFMKIRAKCEIVFLEDEIRKMIKNNP